MSKRTPSYIKVLLILILSLGATYGVLALTVYFLAGSVAEESVAADVKSLPLKMGSWERDGEDKQVGEDVLKPWNVGAESFLIRRYMKDDGNIVDVMLVYKGRDMQGWHTPELCYKGSGFNIKRGTMSVLYAGQETKVNKLSAENKNLGDELVIAYWFVQGKKVETRMMDMQMSNARSTVNPSKYGWVFVRIDTPLVDTEENADKVIKSFMKDASDDLYKAVTGEVYTQTTSTSPAS